MIFSAILLLTLFTTVYLSTTVLRQNLTQELKFFVLWSAGLILCFSVKIFADYYYEDATLLSMSGHSLSIIIGQTEVFFKLDGLSVVFLLLSSLLLFLCILFVWEEPKFVDYSLCLFIVFGLLAITFSSLNLLVFYICFEATLIPMSLMIGLWGSRARRIRAVYLFFFYTFGASFATLIAILYIYNVVGTFDIEYISTYQFSQEQEHALWFAFFLAFASKIPVFPLHIWLPEAHVEAPTVGSVLLAGILLKLGVYGFLRFSLPLFPEASLYFAPSVYTFCLLGIIYGSMCAIGQTDLKRIIAYSSVAHMNLVTLGIFSLNPMGVQGAIVQSMSHGFVSGGLFFLIGIIYSRYHTRSLHYYGGLAHCMPIYAIFFVILTMANIALPGTSSFVGEFLLLLGIYKTNVLSGIVATSGVILSGAYSLWLCNRLLFGNLKNNYTLKYMDLSHKEFIIMLPLIIFVLVLGIYPSLLMDICEISVYSFLYNFEITTL